MIYVQNNFDTNKLTTGLKCPKMDCNQNIDEKIILNFIANDYEKHQKSTYSSQNYKSAIEKEENDFISSQIQNKNIPRAVHFEKEGEIDRINSDRISNESPNDIQRMKVSNSSKESNAEIDEQITNPSCNHSFSLKMFDLLIEENLKENSTIDEIPCLLFF